MKYEKMGKVIISEEIITYFKNKILFKELKRGERLPSEDELASMMGVSRGTMREALKVLIHMGLVERKNRGTYVTESSQSIRDLSEVKTYKDIFDIIEVRKIVEPALAKLAAENINAEVLKKFENEMEYINSVENIETDVFWKHDVVFHDLIFTAAGNKILEDFIKSLKDLVYKNQSIILNNEEVNIVNNSIKNHNKIFESIKKRNGNDASKMMLKHIADIEKVLKKIIS